MAGTYGLPTIKCSNCNAEIEISAMGDHICGPPLPQSQPYQLSYWEKNSGPPSGFSNPDAGRDPQNTRPGRTPPGRIDPGVANRPFQRSGTLGPGGRGGNHHGDQPLDPNGVGRRTPMRSYTSPLPRDMNPPSPEFSNLDCAFPPFVDSRTATPTAGSPSHPDMEHEYVRAHAEPNFYGPRSPRRGNDGLMQRMNTITPGPFASNRASQDKDLPLTPHSRSTSVGGRRPDRSLRQPEPIVRPSTAGPEHQKKPSLHSLSNGPRGNRPRPPIPGNGPNQGIPPRQDSQGQPNIGNYGQQDEPPQWQDGGHGGVGPSSFYHGAIPPQGRQPPVGGLVMPDDRAASGIGNGPYDQYGGQRGQQNFDSVPSPTRSQTFPRRDERRSGPNGTLPRRPSEPSPAPRSRTPSNASRNGPSGPFGPFNPGNTDGPTPRPPLGGPFPPRMQSRSGMRDDNGPLPPRGQPSMNAGLPPRGQSRSGPRPDFENGPFPPRTTSRNDVRGRDRAPTNPPAPYGSNPDFAAPPPRNASRSRGPGNYPGPRDPVLPVLNTATDYDVGDPYHTPSNSASSNASSLSGLASSRSSPPLSEASFKPRRKGSDTSQLDNLINELDPDRNAYNKKVGTKYELHLPAINHVGPDSPTDPAFQQGRISPISTSASQKSKSPQPGRRPTTANKGNCRGCGEKIVGKSVSSADGRLTGRYHKECFVCKTCSEPFATADFYVIKNHPYCARHYHALNGSLCNACDQGIEGQFLETESKQKFHPACFTCTTCKQILRDDYFEMNGKPYCERDAMRAVKQPLPGKGALGLPGGPPGRMYPERRTTRLMMMEAIQ